jgi:hypothetical protein
MLEHLLLGQHRDELARGHRKGARKQTGNASQYEDRRLCRCTGHAHDQASVGYQPVIDAEHSCPQRSAAIGLVPAPNILDRGRPRMAFLHLPAIDRNAAHLGGREHGLHRTRAEGLYEKGRDPGSERRLEGWDRPEVLGENAGLLFCRVSHLPEEARLGGIRPWPRGSWRSSRTASARACPPFRRSRLRVQIKPTLPVARS